jgi:SPP1 family phage portal protein
VAGLFREGAKMEGDIKTDVLVYEYDQLNKQPGEELTHDEIIQLINNHQRTFVNKFIDDDRYYYGENSEIVDAEEPDDVTSPDNRIAIPYARTMTHTIKGYMYRPGLIRYRLNDPARQQDMDRISEIFRRNNEPIKNAEGGERQSKYGVNFELLWIDPDLNLRFSLVNPREVFPVYDYSIEKKMIAAIRYFVIDRELQKIATDMSTSTADSVEVVTYRVEVYYTNKTTIYDLKGDSLTLKEEKANFFGGEIPLIEYKNNTEIMSDHAPVKSLINGMDKVVSRALNEMDRFAFAYLVLKNYIFENEDDETEMSRKMTVLKDLRIFAPDENGDVKFLTKDIPDAFIKTMRDTFREDIQYHSGIPDFRDSSFGTSSGIAIQYKLIGFENLAANKESWYREGLEKRLSLIQNYLQFKENMTPGLDIEITFDRNIPENVKDSIENFTKVFGIISDETALGLLPFIRDINKEIEAMEAGKEDDDVMIPDGPDEAAEADEMIANMETQADEGDDDDEV